VAVFIYLFVVSEKNIYLFKEYLSIFLHLTYLECQLMVSYITWENFISPYCTIFVSLLDYWYIYWITLLFTHTHWPTKMLLQLILGLSLKNRGCSRANFWMMLKQVSPTRTPWILLHIGVPTAKFIYKKCKISVYYFVNYYH
jgi:hypothetical protein